VSEQTAYKAALERQPVTRISGVEQLPKLHLGRFSEGIEQLPETPGKLHFGRFSEGIEQLPEIPGKLHLGRFSEGMEQLPGTARNLRRGSFADGYEEVRRRWSHGLSLVHLLHL
jgi:hypothetical protein